jgi:hypothetical protein
MAQTHDDLDDGPSANGSHGGPSSWRTAIEDRVRTLEVKFAEYQAVMEGSDHVIAKLAEPPSTPPPLLASDRVLVLAASQTAPTPPAPPQGAVLHPPESTIPTTRGWFLMQLAAEFRLMVRMYFDPRYRISRTTQFVLPGIVLLAVLNYFLFASWFSIAIVGPVLERIIDMVLCVIGYKLLTWETGRYRDVLNYLGRYQQ